MILKADSLPILKSPTAEGIKIKNIFNSYNETANVYVQDNNKAFISMLDGDVIIQNIDANIEELSSFIGFIRPKSIFSDVKTLEEINCKKFLRANVLMKKCQEEANDIADPYKSDDIYMILRSGGFELPSFESFATDFCCRKNKGTLNCFYLRDLCVSITLNADNYCLLNGIVSLKKGYGKVALKNAVAQNKGKTMVAVCEDKIKEFYIKNDFSYLYEVGYWTERI